MKLPLIITRDLVTFPKFPLQFQIGRPQTIKTATAAFNDHNGLVLITAQKDPNIDEIKTDNIYETAILAKITSYNPDAPTPITIAVLGEQRVTLTSFEEKDIIYAEYKGIVDKNDSSEDAKKIQEGLLKGIEDSLAAFPGMSADQMIAPFANAKPSEFADSFAFYLPLSVKEKYDLLGEADVVKRLQLLKNKLEQMAGMAPITDDANANDPASVSNEVNKKVNDKLQKQQREFMLREQLKQIEEELGEITGEENDINTLLDEVEKNPYPEAVKAKLRKELKRLKSTPSASVEYGIIRSYIDTVMEVP